MDWRMGLSTAATMGLLECAHTPFWQAALLVIPLSFVLYLPLDYQEERKEQ